MSYILYKTVNFGSNYAGLNTVGYKLIDNTGSVVATRTTSGVQSLGQGVYGASVTFSNGFAGSIYWDTTNGSTVSAVEEINPQTGEYLDTNISSRAPSTGVNINLAQNIGASQTAGSLGRALQLARADAGGNWTVDLTNNTLTLLDTDGTTVIKVFNLTPTGGPYNQRTASANG